MTRRGVNYSTPSIIAKPYLVVLYTTALSFTFWLFPSFNGNVRKGFENYFSPSVIGIVTCILWLTVIFLQSYSGFKIGSRLKISTERLDKYVGIDSYRPYAIITILGLVGIFFVVLKIISALGFSGAMSSIFSGHANDLKSVLYDDYSVGLPSLRYMAIPASALGLYHFMHKRYLGISIISIASLLLISIVSSRLSIIYAIFIFLCLIYTSSNIKLNGIKIIVGIFVIFNLLTVLNYSRNSNFYKSIGISNLYAAGFSEIVTYVGSPFQGFLAAGDYRDLLFPKSEEETHSYTGISIQLSTNSSFLELLRENGLKEAFLYVTFSSFLGGLLMGIGQRNKDNLLSLITGIVGYCFAEVWRVFLFGQGIFATLLIVTILISLYCAFVPKSNLILFRVNSR